MLRPSRQQQITSLQGVSEGKENVVTFNVTKNSQAAKTPGGNALRDLTNKTPHLKTVKFGNAEKKNVEKNDKKKAKAKKAQNNVIIPDIEYCPPPIEEPPFEPDDEGLKIDFELFNHPLNFDVYEFENIIYEEPPMPKFDERDLCYGKVMTEGGKYNNSKDLFYPLFTSLTFTKNYLDLTNYLKMMLFK
ncbi:hypothetical protein C1645_822361 [Glomus cerebriforme]|uniref:Uncharacterized protein n=1 Tax=Glomus cerebriforme TaxID=658196 RepID=A0A397SZ41_9GLOM|nr:hypothetical protein C1645_822361 [Glomus cerebriforme]